MTDYSKLDKLSDLIMKEIEAETNKGSLTPDSVRTIGYGVDILKDITCMKKDESEMENGYSGHYPQRGYNITPYYSYQNNSGMIPENSYVQRRDSMGRYSREGHYDNYGGSYGYSREDNIERLEQMMTMARNDQEREAIRKVILQMEKD